MSYSELRTPNSELRSSLSAKGVTLIELLITIVIGSIAMMALAMPFIAERTFWGSGKAQTEAQRDAQVALRAMARVARESACYAIDADSTGVTFYADQACSASCKAYFDGDPSAGAGFLNIYNPCGAAPTPLIDGTRSRVQAFSVTSVTNRLVQIQLNVIHNNRENELLVTELFLRNAS